MQFLSNFRKTWWLRLSKTFKKEKVCCLRGFFEEVKAISAGKMHQMHTKVDEKLKSSDF